MLATEELARLLELGAMEDAGTELGATDDAGTEDGAAELLDLEELGTTDAKELLDGGGVVPQPIG